MTRQRVGRSSDRTAIEDEALAQIAGRAPQPPASPRIKPGWIEIVGAGLWLCVLGMIAVAVAAISGLT